MSTAHDRMHTSHPQHSRDAIRQGRADRIREPPLRAHGRRAARDAAALPHDCREREADHRLHHRARPRADRPARLLDRRVRRPGDRARATDARPASRSGGKLARRARSGMRGWRADIAASAAPLASTSTRARRTSPPRRFTRAPASRTEKAAPEGPPMLYHERPLARLRWASRRLAHPLAGSARAAPKTLVPYRPQNIAICSAFTRPGRARG